MIVGVGHTGTRLTIQAAQEAKKLGADMVNAIPPYYFKYDEEHTIRHYRLLLDAVGGHGVVSMEVTIAPELCMAIYKAAQDGRNREAIELQRKLYRLSKVLFVPPHDGRRSGKAALAALGLCKKHVTAPFEPATADMTEEITAALRDLKLV